MSGKRQSALLFVAAIVWIAGTACGYVAMWKFQHKAGEDAVAPVTWPASSRLSRAPNAPTVVMFAHPRCPCTRASVAELRALLGTNHGAAVKTYVLVFKPHDFADGWEKTDVWRNAASIPGVTVLSDVDGREAARLGARTSGQTLVYNAGGQLVFSGGITALRGEVGDNRGTQSVAAIVEGHAPVTAATPVFGCAIQDKKKL
jgi:hypothetical protein